MKVMKKPAAKEREQIKVIFMQCGRNVGQCTALLAGGNISAATLGEADFSIKRNCDLGSFVFGAIASVTWEGDRAQIKSAMENSTIEVDGLSYNMAEDQDLKLNELRMEKKEMIIKIPMKFEMDTEMDTIAKPQAKQFETEAKHSMPPPTGTFLK